MATTVSGQMLDAANDPIVGLKLHFWPKVDSGIPTGIGVAAITKTATTDNDGEFAIELPSASGGTVYLCQIEGSRVTRPYEFVAIGATMDVSEILPANDGSDLLPANTPWLLEYIRDTIAAFLAAGSNVTLTHNDAANTFTIAATGGGITIDGNQTSTIQLVSPLYVSLGTGDDVTLGIDLAAYATTTDLANGLDAKQPLDADLTAIAGLAGTNGFLKKAAANTWSLDTASYLSLAGGQMTATIRTTEVINEPTGTAQTITLDNGNHQTLRLVSASGAVTVTLTVPTSSAAGTILVIQGATVRNITWAVSSGSIIWMGGQPTWSSDASNSRRIVSWRWNGSVMHLAPTESAT